MSGEQTKNGYKTEHMHESGHAQDICEGDSCCIGEGCGAGCSACGHAHDEPSNPWKQWLSILSGAALFAAALLTKGVLSTVLFFAAYALLGMPVLLQAARDIGRGQVFGESFLMGIATIGAFALAEYGEAVAVMLFYRVGEYFQDLAVDRSRSTIRSAVDLRPDTARVLRDGAWVISDPMLISAGERILVEPGERIPLDGKVLSGESRVDNSAITGESVPERAAPGREVMAGGINQSGPLTLEVLRVMQESAAGRILRAVEDAAKGKPRLENFITRFARVYTPVVVGLAVLLSTVPPLFGAGAFTVWLHRALLFLVISCPCALVISVPLTFFAGLAHASARGVLFKGANRMEALAKINAAVFDKTGTLTRGVFEVQQVFTAEGFEPDALLRLAAAAEHHSPHPVAKAILKAAGEYTPAEEVQELAGRGVSALISGKRVLVGNARLLQEAGVTPPEIELGTVAYIAVDGAYAGAVIIADTLKQDAADAVRKLNRLVGYTAILTGDAAGPAQLAAQRTGASQVFAKLLPEEKLSRMQEIRARHGRVLFVGDGINDAPVLMGADVGMAVGGSGTDMAVEAADVVLLSPELTAVPDAVQQSRRTISVARVNIVFAIGIKTLVMALGAFGIANMWMAVFADVGTALLCVLNALRLLPGKRKA